MTDRNIRVLFWLPTRVNANDLDFADCVETLSNRADLQNYVSCAGGLRIRAERINPTDMKWEGDFVRQQVDNVPPIAPQSQPLQANPNPIGHRAAFLYSLDCNVLALQTGRPGVSASAVNSYIRNKIHGHRGFFMDPCLTSDALEKLRAGTPKHIEMRVAKPSDLARLDPDYAPIEDSLATLQNLVEGHTIKISVAAEPRNRDSHLNLRGVLRMFRWASQNRGQVSKLKVKLEEEDHEIDLFAERMEKRGVIDLDAADLNAAYDARLDFVRLAFAEQEADIRELYGQGQ